MNKIQPIIKWAGGKRWLVSNYINMFPSDYHRHVEPFLGGASVFLGLLPKRALLADVNDELINAYLAIRDNWERVEQGLILHQKKHSKDHYYSIRSKKPSDKIEAAIRFLYLNRTCWNGLYRVNKKGEFNVPIGTKNKVILPTDNFEELSKYLNNKVEFLVQEFTKTFEQVNNKDFVYVDPPYVVNHNKNGFLKYNESIFAWSDQEKLRDEVDNAAIKGAKILISQSNHESIRNLYQDIGEIHIVKRASIIAANTKYRNPVEEILIRINY